jgi:hypothetical protein
MIYRLDEVEVNVIMIQHQFAFKQPAAVLPPYNCAKYFDFLYCEVGVLSSSGSVIRMNIHAKNYQRKHSINSKLKSRQLNNRFS